MVPLNNTVASSLGACSSAPLGLSSFGEVCDYPWYYAKRPEVFSGIPDKYMSLLLPVLVYWGMSLLFHFITSLNFKFIRSSLIHDNDASVKLNKVTIKEVTLMVFSQEILQTIVGIMWLDGDDNPYGPKGALRDQKGEIERVARNLSYILSYQTFSTYGPLLTRWFYWYINPVVRLVFAAFIMDGWQYFWHRYFHVNKFFYKHVHSWHHRLYAPYAFGALYNHPLEGFVLDTLGSGVSELLAGLTLREAMLFFCISMAKTVDDHCGIRIKYDPLQYFFFNNCDYHDIHHQIIGLKYNFSQPYFIHFDYWFGTRMTRAEYEERRSRKKSLKPSEVEAETVTDKKRD